MKILIIDDHALVRRGMVSLLREHLANPEFGEAATSREGFSAILEQSWDLAIIDISMPGRNGLELLRDIRGASLPCRCWWSAPIRNGTTRSARSSWEPPDMPRKKSRPTCWSPP